jgi:hypothetical protein
MQTPLLVALAATALYAHGTCASAPQTTGSVPVSGTAAATSVFAPPVRLAAATVGSAARRDAGAHCSLATSPGGIRVVAYRGASTASASDDVPAPWGCYPLRARALASAANGDSAGACPAFPTVDALPEVNPFS